MTIKDNILAINSAISLACTQQQRSPSSVQLLAVSKTKPASAIESAYHVGQRHFGENYLQEAIEKISQLSHLPEISWHFIGPIQSNKTKQIATHFSWVHSVDRIKIAKRLNEQLVAQDTPLNICLQVNISEESTKSGVSIADLPALAEFVDSCENLSLRGLMAIPEKADASASFNKMNTLFLTLKKQYSSVDTLSMGMSADMTQAIANGSTMVRVGTAIFGKRA